ncbi:type I restriction endonuclease [Paraburkholderia dipogonis]|uniref:type I restriction endonuclease n=1 Tax=Paraburkholderia dipogonis TaxID=1211383 RepID=UPI001FCAF3CB|nr:hypothetical protein [Paraburkholderia dipogonis]
MDFIDEVRALAARVATAKDMVQTEEATKNAMVMPFIHLLGYNVFDPLEVTPELIADVGTKKGEKVDYAILKDGKPIMLFECKKSGDDLDINHASQLFRYFHMPAGCRRTMPATQPSAHQSPNDCVAHLSMLGAPLWTFPRV